MCAFFGLVWSSVEVDFLGLMGIWVCLDGGNCGKSEMEAGFLRWVLGFFNMNGFSFLISRNFPVIKQNIWVCGSLFSAVILWKSASAYIFFVLWLNSCRLFLFWSWKIKISEIFLIIYVGCICCIAFVFGCWENWRKGRKQTKKRKFWIFCFFLCGFGFLKMESKIQSLLLFNIFTASKQSINGKPLKFSFSCWIWKKKKV